MSLRVVSYGGGVQSTALLVLAAQRRIDFPLFLMANVGDDSEHPATLTYVRDVAMPYAEEHGIRLELLDKQRQGETETLYKKLTRTSKSVSIPYRSTKDGPPMSRSCTAEFKIRVTGRRLRELGASADAPAIVALGISLDEISRANTTRREPWETVVYPLIAKGINTGLQLRRSDCAQLIADAGLPVPPKSSCWFCPHHKLGVWADMRRTEPELFDRAADLESLLDAKSRRAGNGPVFISRAGIPLREAIADNTATLFEDADNGCDSGWCMT